MRPEAKRAAGARSEHTDRASDVDDSRQRQSEPLSRIGDAGAGPEEQRRGGAGRREPLSVCVERAVEDYFDDLDGEQATELYKLVLDEVEEPLLRSVMRHAAGNQSRAAEMLGLSRGTLRKKLKQYGLL